MRIGTTIKKLKERNKQSGMKVSVYIPTHPDSNGPHVQEDRTRLKNAILTVKNQAEQMNGEAETLRTCIKQLEKLHDDLDFWLRQSRSLAIFCDSNDIVAAQLPIELTEITHIGDRFMLAPLLLAQGLQIYSLLFDMNLENPRLFRADMMTIEPVSELTFVSMQTIMEGDYEHHQQFYSPRGGESGSAPMFHGHGGSEDHKQEEIDIYLHYVAHRLNSYLLQQQEQLPLVLTGEKHRLAELERLLQYAPIHNQKIYGNNQHMNKAQLHQLLQPLLLDMSQAAMDSAKRQLLETKKKAEGWDEVVEALHKNAVSRLYVPVVRKTNDGVRDGYTDSLILDLSDAPDELETYVTATVDQGGEIQATLRSNTVHAFEKPQALMRF